MLNTQILHNDESSDRLSDTSGFGMRESRTGTASFLTALELAFMWGADVLVNGSNHIEPHNTGERSNEPR